MPPLNELETTAYKRLLAREKAYERKTMKALVDALTIMRGEMARIYDKYAVDGVLTKAEMTRYNRYATMETQMLAALDPALKANIKTIELLRPEQYEAAFFNYAWAMDNGAGVRVAWGTINRAVVLENLANPWLDIAKERYKLEGKLQVRAALNNGLSLGKSYAAMSKDLKKAINRTAYETMRILRTEGQTAINAGQDDAYTKAQEKGIEGNVKWDATLDGKTRPDHGAMDGENRQSDGLFNGPGGERAPYPTWEGLSAGQRIQCRCRLSFEVEGYSPQLRRSRDEGIIPYQTYSEWEKTHR